MKRLALALCFFLTSAACYAAAPCPWINAATAFGALGASSDAAGASSVNASSSCTFTYRMPNGLRELRVTVEQSSDAPHSFVSRKAACSSGGRPLTAIGNEAIACAANSDRNSYGEQIIARVRDQVFTVTMTVDTPKTGATVKDLQQRVEMLAELISGNLF
jgi:hypothetical protein